MGRDTATAGQRVRQHASSARQSGRQRQTVGELSGAQQLVQQKRGRILVGEKRRAAARVRAAAAGGEAGDRVRAQRFFTRRGVRRAQFDAEEKAVTRMSRHNLQR